MPRIPYSRPVNYTVRALCESDGMMTATTCALVARLAELLSNERAALADFLVALADFDRHRRWEEAGYASLYDFLVRELGMSKGTTFYRRVAVELVQRLPEVLEPLRDGRLCITAVHALSKAITPANRAEVLPRFFHVSMREAKAIAARIAPAIEVPRRESVSTVRVGAPLDVGQVPNRLGNVGAQATPSSQAPALSLVPSARPHASGPVTRTAIEPLTAAEHRLHLTVSPEFLEMLDACKKALSHTMPGADAAAVLAEGMKLLLAKDAKKKGLVAKPRPRKALGRRRFQTRYLPADVRRAIWQRDQGRCQWPLEKGGVCSSEFQPELDHIHGYRPGEPVKLEDLRVLCHHHNQLHARQVFGDAYMRAFRRPKVTVRAAR